MFRKGFFTSTTWTINGDGFAIGNNAEGADFLAKILYTVLGDGAAAVTKTGFQTVKKTGLTCTVKPFFIAKSGYFAWDTADTDITFTSSTSEQVFYVGARLDLANNTYTGGIAARTTFVAGTDLVSAKITIPANAVALTDGMIEDLRYNTTYCGQIDEYRERSLALIAELEVALDALISGSVPAHASTHAVGQSDALTGYATIDANSKVTASETSSYINAQTDNYTLVLADAGKFVKITHASGKTLTVPKNSSVAFPVGTEIEIYQGGAGQVTIAPVDGDVTLRNADNALKIEKIYCSAGLKKIGENEWVVSGRTVA